MCADRGVFFTYVDLRWGITSEQTDHGKTIHICLQEVCDQMTLVFTCKNCNVVIKNQCFTAFCVFVNIDFSSPEPKAHVYILITTCLLFICLSTVFLHANWMAHFYAPRAFYSCQFVHPSLLAIRYTCRFRSIYPKRLKGFLETAVTYSPHQGDVRTYISTIQVQG